MAEETSPRNILSPWLVTQQTHEIDGVEQGYLLSFNLDNFFILIFECSMQNHTPFLTIFLVCLRGCNCVRQIAREIINLIIKLKKNCF